MPAKKKKRSGNPTRKTARRRVSPKKAVRRKKNAQISHRWPFALSVRGLNTAYFLLRPASYYDALKEFPHIQYLGYEMDPWSDALLGAVALTKEGKGKPVWKLRTVCGSDYDKLGKPFKSWKSKPRLLKKVGFTIGRKGAPSRFGLKRRKKLIPTKTKKNPQLMIVGNPRTRLSGAALAAYRAFHGTAPMRVSRVRVPPGTPRFLVELGKANVIEYVPTNKSQLADRRAKKTIMKHKFGRHAMLVTDPAGQFIGIVNPKGTTRVSGLKRGQRKIGIVG